MAKKHTHSHIHVHHDGSHTLHRHFKHQDGSTSMLSSGHHDLDSLHDAIQTHMGAPNPGEAEADAGNHGVPEAQAKPAGLPMTPPPAAPGAGA